MRRFRSLLIDEANIRIPGLVVTRLALHRHLDEHASVEPHRHKHCQALLYLGNKGRQVVDGINVQVEPGTLVVVPPGAAHAFHRADRRPPLCLAIDFRVHPTRTRTVAVCNVNRSAITEVRHNLAQLIRLRTTTGDAFHWDGAIIVLQTLMLCLRAAGWIEPSIPSAATGESRGIQRLLATMPLEGSLLGVIQRSGYQRDHLNRLVKQDTGLSLGQFRAQQRLIKAKELLSQGVSIASTAAVIGLPDSGYFARWFRRQTGQAPSVWTRGRRNLRFPAGLSQANASGCEKSVAAEEMATD
jgi:AraC family L-rhamnose operon transcriptional activator RhaR